MRGEAGLDAGKFMTTLIRYAVLTIDEIGYLPLSRDQANVRGGA